MIRYDHYTDKFVKVSDKECPWCKAVCASTDKYCHECGWHIADAPQTEMCDTCKYRSSNVFGNWCVGRNTCDRYEADTPQTDCDTCRHYKLACELFSEVCKYEPTTQNSNLTFETDTPQTESTGSPIGDYRDGVGSWQTDCGWK